MDQRDRGSYNKEWRQSLTPKQHEAYLERRRAYRKRKQEADDADKKLQQSEGPMNMNEPVADTNSGVKKSRCDADLKRVADIVLCLSTLAMIRGGEEFTESENQIIEEARARLVQLCQDFSPNDIISRDIISAQIDNLGLNPKVKEQGLGFRGPQLTVAEKFVLTKRKMDESKKYAAQTAAFASQPFNANYSAAPETSESHAIQHTASMSTDNQKHAPTVTSGYTSPLTHVSSVTPSARYQLPRRRGSYVRRYLSVPTMPRGAYAYFLPQATQPSSGQQPSPKNRFLQTSSLLNNHNEISRIILKLLQPQVPNRPWITQSRDYMSKPLACQTCQITINEVNNVLICDACDKGYHIACAQSSNQREIPSGEWHCTRCISLSNGKPMPPKYGRVLRRNVQLKTPYGTVASSTVAAWAILSSRVVVQKILQPQVRDHPKWIPPSRDYMSETLTCQTCQISINEINNVLICDACDKGYHITCAQLSNQREIPSGEWYCTRCFSLSNGEPLPPKYGSVMRRNVQSKSPSSTVASGTVAASAILSSTAVQISSGNKVGDLDEKAFEQDINAHVSYVPQNPVHAVGMRTSRVKSEPDSEGPFSSEMQGNSLPSSSKNTVKQSSKQIGNPDLYESDGTTSQSRAEPSSDMSNKDANSNFSSASETEGNKVPSSSNNMDEKTLFYDSRVGKGLVIRTFQVQQRHRELVSLRNVPLIYPTEILLQISNGREMQGSI